MIYLILTLLTAGFVTAWAIERRRSATTRGKLDTTREELRQATAAAHVHAAAARAHQRDATRTRSRASDLELSIYLLSDELTKARYPLGRPAPVLAGAAL